MIELINEGCTSQVDRPVLIESDMRLGRYDMAYTRAIVEDQKHGRILIVEGFGGYNSLLGGAYRWKHGLAAKLQDGDTLETLDTIRYSEIASQYEAMITAHDSDRPLLFWSGWLIMWVAESVNL